MGLLWLPRTLTHLVLENTDHTDIRNLSEAPNITHLEIKRCPELTQIMTLPAALTHLEIEGCPKLWIEWLE